MIEFSNVNATANATTGELRLSIEYSVSMNDFPDRNRPKQTRAYMRREVLTASTAFVLSGCTVPAVFANIGTVTRTSILGLPDAPVATAYIQSLPYATISAKIGKGQRSVLVLARFDGPDLHWVSADHAVFVTRNGRLIRVFGVGASRTDTLQLDRDPICSGSYDFDRESVRAVDLAADQRYGVPIKSTYRVLGRETIAIMDHQIDVLRVREFSSAVSFRWTFENDFWFDFSDGFLWKSVQNFNPEMAPAEITVLKPARV